MGLGRSAPQPIELLVDRAWHQADIHRPRPQLRGGGARGPVAPHPPQHRRGSLPGRGAPLVQGARTTRRISRPTPTGSTSSRPT